MNVHRLTKTGDLTHYRGMQYAKDINEEEVLEFCATEKVKPLLNYIPDKCWIILDEEGSLCLCQPDYFEKNGWAIDNNPVYWEVYEIDQGGGNRASLVLRTTLEEQGFSSLGSVVTQWIGHDAYSPTASYLLMRNDGYVSVMNNSELTL